MKVLFVCRGNVARSQMAEGLYNSLFSGSRADSAGTHVEHPGQTLADRKIARQKQSLNSYVLDVMDDVGIDISNNVSTQLTKEMLDTYDVVVSMAGKKYTPTWLSQSPKYVYWKVSDPMGRNYKVTAVARDVIKQRILDLHSAE